MKKEYVEPKGYFSPSMKKILEKGNSDKKDSSKKIAPKKDNKKKK